MKDPDNDLHVCPNCDQYTEETEYLNMYNQMKWVPCQWCGVVFDPEKVETK